MRDQHLRTRYEFCHRTNVNDMRFDTCVICVICPDALCAICALRVYTRWHKCNFHVTPHKFTSWIYFVSKIQFHAISHVTSMLTRISLIIRTVITLLARRVSMNAKWQTSQTHFIINVFLFTLILSTNENRIYLELTSSLSRMKNRESFTSHIINVPFG